MALAAVVVISLLYAAEQAIAKRKIGNLAANLQTSLDRSNRLAGELETSLKESERRVGGSLSRARPVRMRKGGYRPRHGLDGRELWRGGQGRRYPVAARCPRQPGRLAESVSRAYGSLPSRRRREKCSVQSRRQSLVTASDDGTARQWNVATGQPMGEPLAHQKSVTAVAFSADGTTIITGSWDKTAQLWAAATSKPIGPPLVHEATVRTVLFSPDGKTAITGSEDSTARLWLAATGEPKGPALDMMERSEPWHSVRMVGRS